MAKLPSADFQALTMFPVQSGEAHEALQPHFLIRLPAPASMYLHQSIPVLKINHRQTVSLHSHQYFQASYEASHGVK